jgi:septal ring factor EnvC (AmiA/AmiB activator)
VPLVFFSTKLREYWDLKKKVTERSREQIAKLNNVNRQQKDDQESLDSLFRQKVDQDNRVRQLTHEISESTKRVEKLKEHIRLYETSLDEQRRIRDELKTEVGSSKGSSCGFAT